MLLAYFDFVWYLDGPYLFGAVSYPDYLLVLMLFSINVRDYRRGNQKFTIQRNWKHRAHNMKKNTTQKHNTICDGHQINTNNMSPPTNNVNKT